MKKRAVAFILAFFIFASLFPVTASASEDVICVGGVYVNKENAADVLGDGTVSYSFSDNTLTLRGAEINSAQLEGIYCGIYFNCSEGVTVKTESDSRVIGKTDSEAGEKPKIIGIFSMSDITFKGNGKLTVETGEAYDVYGIWTEGDMTFSESKVYCYALYASHDGISLVIRKNLCFNDAKTGGYGCTAAFYIDGGFIIESGTYYIGVKEPDEKFPRGYGYIVSSVSTVFTVRWKNYDGSILKTDSVPLGETPVYSGKTPKRPDDEHYTYTFIGWNKRPEPIFTDTVYTAKFSASLIYDEGKLPSEEETEKEIIDADTDKADPKGSSFLPLMLRAKGKKQKITLSWKRLKEADGYIIYGARCGKKMKRLKTLASSKKVKYSFKGLKKGKYYKYIVVAYKELSGKRATLAKSKSVHCATKGGKKGNPTGVKLNKTALTIKKGKSVKLSPKLVSKKKVATHIAKFRYESSDKKIALVTKSGKIKAKKKGTAFIYIITQNGIYKRVRVTVK